VEYKKLGRFTIEHSVAKGGMGEVIRSVDDGGMPIALKTILDCYQDNERFRNMFVREAEITFTLDHPNIVKAYRFSKIGNRLVLAMEYLDGVTVREILRRLHDRKLQMPVPIALAIMERVLLGLEYAHTKKDENAKDLGIIHRDLNPSNVFVTFKGEVKILDFGISKATMKEVHQLSPKSELKGKISYLSPEQIKGRAVDARTDIFTAGVALWEMLAARPLYLRATDGEAMAAICDGEYQSLRDIRSDVPFALEAVIREALTLDSKKRISSAQEFSVKLIESVRGFYLPGVSEEEISAFSKSLFGKVENPEDPLFASAFAWLITMTPGHQRTGLEQLENLAARNPSVPYVQMNYARAQLLCGDRNKGLRLMRRLARVDSLEQDVQKVLEWLGVRRRPMIESLSRGHPLNRSLGWVRHKILGPTPYQKQFLAA
jgi:serine/threonine-protein kinase